MAYPTLLAHVVSNYVSIALVFYKFISLSQFKSYLDLQNLKYSLYLKEVSLGFDSLTCPSFISYVLDFLPLSLDEELVA